MMKTRAGLVVCGLTLMLLEAALASDTARVTVGPALFDVELARTAEERARGLMFRQALPKDRGMLFIQPLGPAAFWMKNTYLALDLLYFDADGQLVQIVPNAPPCAAPTCPIYQSGTATVRYTLEINAGEAEKRGIRPGDRLRLQ